MKCNHNLYGILLAGAALLTVSCSQDYLETAPTRYIEEEAVSKTMQSDPSRVQAYVNGAYMNIYCGGDYWTTHDDFGLPALKLATDLNCEDISIPRNTQWFCYDYQLDNRMGNYRRTSTMWNQLYYVIDNTNTIITMLKPAEGEQVADRSARVMLGEAYALRAYCYFWLVNIWQHPYGVNPDAPGVPLKTEEQYRQERVPVKEIYAQIQSDLDVAYGYLKGLGYHAGKGGLSEYAAAAIYANVLLFTGDYAGAATYAEAAIQGGSGFNSAADMLGGFNTLDMPEVIWGYNVTEETTGYYASFFSHVDSYMVGYGGQVGYRKVIASDLYNRIADNDVRKGWFGLNDDYNLLGIDYAYEASTGNDRYIQNKFRDVYMTTYGNASPFTSAIIFFRTAEMYFVAAEAYYLAGNEAKAREMLEALMGSRVPGYTCAASGQELYDEICIQKRIEMWMEGCRFLDAKRRGETIDRTKSTNHPVSMSYSARDYRMVYRIPNSEMENNPAITPADDNE